MKYRREIDGLRALAVLPVMLFHAGIELFGGGFVGVDVFFLISGYLITTIIVDDIEVGRFSLGGFYERRARRLLPALTIVTLFVTVAGWVVLNPIELNKFGTAMLGVATFTSNFVFWRNQGYFDESAELNPLLHTWSLAVEEQFYIFFPIFLIVVYRFGAKKVFWLIVVFASISLAVSEWGVRYQPVANFYLAPTRAWELFAGSIGAFIIHKRGVRSNNLLALSGLTAILFAVIYFTGDTPFPSLYTLIPVLGTLFIILFADRGTYVARILGSKLLVGLGLISYSAYLWHQPVLVFFRKIKGTVHISLGDGLLLIFLILGVAFLTWKYIETPFRDSRKFSNRFIASVSLLSLVLIGYIGVLSRSASQNYEYALAESLAGSNFVYFSNIDERVFSSHRLSFMSKPIDTLVMGSSRIMLVGSEMLNRKTLNLSVSAASIEDDIAFIGEGVARLKPNHVLIGVDPWLLNLHDNLDNYKTVSYLYDYWLVAIQKQLNGGLESPSYLSQFNSSAIKDNLLARRLFDKINLFGSMVAQNGDPEDISKKAYDGTIIYDTKYISKSPLTITKEFDVFENYAMRDFDYDYASENKLRNLVEWLKLKGIEVNFVLTPYHPDLYLRMTANKQVFQEVELRIISLADELEITLLGSYDPVASECLAADFYDGLHPNRNCMERILTEVID